MLCGLFLETPSLKLIETEGQEAGQCSGARSPSPHGSLAVPVTRRVASASAQPLGHPDSVFCAMLAQRRIGNRDTWVPALPGGRLGRPGRLRVPSEPQGCPPARRRRRPGEPPVWFSAAGPCLRHLAPAATVLCWDVSSFPDGRPVSLCLH